MGATNHSEKFGESTTGATRRLFLKAAAATGAVASVSGVSIAQEGEDDETDEEIITEGPTIGLELVGEGFTSPVGFEVAPDQEDRYYVVDQVGQIRVLENGMGDEDEDDGDSNDSEDDEDGDNGDENGDDSGSENGDEDDGDESEDGENGDSTNGPAELQDEPFLDLTDRMVEVGAATDAGFDERGLLGLAFHPDFQENGRFFVRYSAPPGDDTPEDYDHTAVLAEFTTEDDDHMTADPDSETILLEEPEPQFNHNAGSVLFGPDGYLYVPLGDGGDADDTGLGHVEDWYEDNEGGNAQDTTENFLGGILRIDVDSEGEDDQPYGIPDDNPLVDSDEGMDEYYAWGLRNPWRASFDSDGQFFVADVGQNLFEEVNIVENGGNYGWNVKEGIECFSTESPDEPGEDCPSSTPEDVRGGEDLLDPVIHYPHQADDETIGISITGGYHYEGEAVSDLEDMYVYGDWSTNFAMPAGRLFASPVEEYEPSADRSEEDLWEIQELSVSDSENDEINRFVLAFGRDHDDELYVLTTARYTEGETGEVWRIVPEGEGETIEQHEDAVGSEEVDEEEESGEEETSDNETETDDEVETDDEAETGDGADNETDAGNVSDDDGSVGNETDEGDDVVGNETDESGGVGNESDDNQSGG